METTHTKNLDKMRPESARDRSHRLGVPQRIKKETQGTALSYAMKHKLTMAETFERAIALLIEVDPTPQLKKLDMSKIPDDARGLGEVTLKFTHSEMKAMQEKFGILGLDGRIETFLKSQTDWPGPIGGLSSNQS